VNAAALSIAILVLIYAVFAIGMGRFLSLSNFHEDEE
jgi:hypothetical protein